MTVRGSLVQRQDASARLNVIIGRHYVSASYNVFCLLIIRRYYVSSRYNVFCWKILFLLLQTSIYVSLSLFSHFVQNENVAVLTLMYLEING